MAKIILSLFFVFSLVNISFANNNPYSDEKIWTNEKLDKEFDNLSKKSREFDLKMRSLEYTKALSFCESQNNKSKGGVILSSATAGGFVWILSGKFLPGFLTSVFTGTAGYIFVDTHFKECVGLRLTGENQRLFKLKEVVDNQITYILTEIGKRNIYKDRHLVMN